MADDVTKCMHITQFTAKYNRSIAVSECIITLYFDLRTPAARTYSNIKKSLESLIFLFYRELDVIFTFIRKRTFSDALMFSFSGITFLKIIFQSPQDLAVLAFISVCFCLLLAFDIF